MINNCWLGINTYQTRLKYGNHKSTHRGQCTNDKNQKKWEGKLSMFKTIQGIPSTWPYSIIWLLNSGLLLLPLSYKNINIISAKTKTFKEIKQTCDVRST